MQLRGPWGEGWLFDRLASGARVLEDVEGDTMADASAVAVDVHYRDEIQHCFRAICAMQLEADHVDHPVDEADPGIAAAAAAATEQEEGDATTISRKSLEFVLPVTMTAADRASFFAGYDADGDGTIDFSEFVAMYATLRKKWRFESAWAEFQHIDESGDGKLEIDELRSLVPQGASPEELVHWMARFDRGGKGYITLSDFVAIDSAVQRDTLLLAVGTSFVLTTYFVHSRVTKALLSVFSMDLIEGELFLKREIGTPALTPTHIAMMAGSGIYLALFSVSVPLVGLYLMYQVRHDQDERRVATMAGFLIDGYRGDVAWFWEFVILVRKIVILGVSLFLWEPFMQSFVAIVVLIISLVVQLHLRPFQLAALNLLEAMSLASLLATQLTGVLMWYKQQPGRDDNVELYRIGATVTLFAVNGAVIASFVAVTLWFYLKQKSKLVVQWLPFTLPCFEMLVELEETARWPNGTDLLKSERLDMREAWSYFAAQRAGRLFGHGAAHSARKKALRLGAKLNATVEKLRRALTPPERESEGPEGEGGALELRPRPPGDRRSTEVPTTGIRAQCTLNPVRGLPPARRAADAATNQGRAG